MRSRLFATVGAMMLGLAVALTVPVMSEPAQASCSHAHQLLDGRTGSFTGSGVNIRTGPHTSCTSVGQGQNGQAARYHCWTVGDTVSGTNTWTWVNRGSTSGWVHDSLLSGFGANRRCN